MEPAGNHNQKNLEQIRDSAVSVARLCGIRIRENSGVQSLQTSIKARDDLVTEIDLWSEQQIHAVIRRDFPDHLLIGEETSTALQAERGKSLQELSASGICWVVDPLDGTANFVSGIPFSVVSIAVLVEGRPTVAVVFDPHRDEMFTAIRGMGAQMNGSPIAVRQAARVEDAVVTTGFPASRYQHWKLFRESHLSFIEHCRRVRMLGASALELCWVACGRTDGFFEYHLKCWDVAAGALIVQEAGGQVGCFANPGSEFSLFAETVLASNKTLFPELNSIGYAADLRGRT